MRNPLEAALAGYSDVRLRKVLDPERGFYWLEAKGGQPLDPTTIDALSSQVPIQRTFPTFFRRGPQGDTSRFLIIDRFSVKFAPGVSRAKIDAFNAKYGVEVVPLDSEYDRWKAREHNEYPLRVPDASDLNALEAANRYYESALTVWSVPSFYFDLRADGADQPQSSASDPLYPEQYYLHNTTGNLGTPDVDIDAPEAWAISKGSAAVTVAVLDEGVEPHEDFGVGQLVAGYSAGGGNGYPDDMLSNNDHGQPVAGIIGAQHNSKGVRGIAPNVKIMPINIWTEPFGPETAAVIDSAWQNGADVLNASWSFDYIDEIAAALTRAIQNGRNGKGSVVVTSSGNNEKNEVIFPGTMQNVLVVGFTDENGNKGTLSPCNNEVDIVAPSRAGTVVTMDRMGDDGFNPDNYYDGFGKSSGAAPQAAGVAALMLSVNPYLTEVEVRTLITTNADNYGTTACGDDGEQWDGAGRLNAFQAVDDAATPPPLSVTLSGPTFLHSDETGTWTASVSGGYGSPSYFWEVSPTYSSGWTNIWCSGSSCSRSFINTCDWIRSAGVRVIVTKGAQTDTTSQTVDIAPYESSPSASSGPTPNLPPCSSPQTAATATAAEGNRLAVRALQAEEQGGGTVRLSWQAGGSSPPSRFLVEHRPASTGAWSKLGTVATGGPNSRRDVGSSRAVTYRFRTNKLKIGTHQFRVGLPQGTGSGPRAVGTDDQDGSRRYAGPVTAQVALEESYRFSTHPNPIRERATVELAVKERQEISVTVYDVLGRRVATLYDGPLPAQEPRRLRLDASATGLTSGTYFLRITGEQFAVTRRITVVQ